MLPIDTSDMEARNGSEYCHEYCKNGKRIRVAKTVFIPRYDSSDAGRFVVHFLHDGSYKVFVTKYLLGHRKYPLSGKETELQPGKPLEIIWE